MTLLNFDYNLFQFINHLAAVYPSLNAVMRFFAQQGEYVFYAGIIFYWFTRKEQNRWMVIQSLTAACVALGISGLLGDFLYRDRPFVAHHVIQLIPHATNASFPSDHATGAFVIAASIWFCRKREGWAWLALALGVAFSRVWVGVHYPGDVLAGILLGVFTAKAIHIWLPKWRMGTRFLHQGMILYERLEQRILPLHRTRSNQQASVATREKQ
ncbi:undecaprenyl-diphosphatase [Aneurinibacillus aneurinilyticus]|jgi:undecaprenyl-diphosphatase|uniref:Undecaprenyl-diphosphatase n=2 Tax=Aneurinibacillus aneurinilyticus TaxID=1391 RepID=A0A848D3N8_ANEAE|nr:undecaprenyl-diphosphatase [Aneurinibacillus aneurinilyticus]ERI09277.1 putative bacitracin transport permease protein BcrC [Aneurinibacillus aneurinilyticus ATCC 12856]MCI1694575.1 undecaprenyl-diphosphatase [Aneurinibacillus aneurinilyticus]MED0672243.1 undecaprenyl-diphosphatase [Aneurinibacillus aneurinilyticus]MED0704649.1 undecaprenyl-diphosphatase [Aneurinibacillus aneurinilyticus]MED0724033.1 undecaprenyl-diphosphatase [Aneurinibacillus aneurinilyticus]